ncbi:hypothetical protein GRI34_01025 [Erythrobacter aquimaris]|uniref:Uncharacterized protein n=1 Tax=Qipengyuania aquimaris TaxID=255984 RepID=A0A6I4TIQ7_9SPHN|nr:hypothetical protein [Qipengyuania aquimaris]MXO94997.1 hypothetical protein [Qipengyuania aquimaris]
MDPNLFLIFGFVLIAALLAMTTGILIHRRQVEHEERRAELKVREAEAKAQEARYSNGDYSKIEERLRVLERIATDSNHALASQIDELRDLQQIEDLPARAETAR